MRRFFLLIVLVSLGGGAGAQDAVPLESIEHSPSQALILSNPPVGDEDDPTAPRQIGSQTVEEFRVRTRLTGLKVTPADGPAYYFEDRIGDGSIDEGSGSLEGDINMRKWRIGRF